MNEYPKAMYKGGCPDSCLDNTVTVHSVEQEEDARKTGYETYAEIHSRANAPAKPKRAPKAA